MKFWISYVVVGLVLLQYHNPYITATPLIKEEQARIMAAEYQVVQQMNHRLRFLLEQQEAENTLQEGEDVFQDLQQLEQWLEHLKQETTGENIDELIGMLESLENRMNRTLEAQQHLAQWLPKKQFEVQRVPIPLSSLMDNLRQLIRQRQFETAQDLLDQLLLAMDKQQQALEQALVIENRERFSESIRQLQELYSQAQQALIQEKHVHNLLQPLTAHPHLPSTAKQKAAKLQSKISKVLRRMQSGLQKLPESTLLKTSMSMEELLQSSKSSKITEKQLEQSQPLLAFQAALITQNSLERLNENLRNLQQQAQKFSNNQIIKKREGKKMRRYWSGKGIKPIKFEYEFQANPFFREKIQQQNSGESKGRTKIQEIYLQEVIR